MPEGPEVKTLTDQLGEICTGQFLQNLECLSSSVKYQNYQQLCSKLNSLLPLQILDVRCRGKKQFFILSNGDVWLALRFSLGLSGRWTLSEKVHNHLCFHLSGDVSRLFFNDKMRYGNMFLFSYSDYLKDWNEQGPDLLSENVGFFLFLERITAQKNQNKEICEVLLDPLTISGIGNYLKSEILYFARICPNRHVSTLTLLDVFDIWKYARNIIRESYENNGVSIRDYFDIFDEKGKYSPLIYGRDGKLCPAGYLILYSKFSDGRGTYWVSELQN